nr:MAG TPA: hypothetical protein [Microviridae sp.]
MNKRSEGVRPKGEACTASLLPEPPRWFLL